jgi:hypothetical protein
MVDEKTELTAREREIVRRCVAELSKQKKQIDAKKRLRPLIDWDDKRTSSENRILNKSAWGDCWGGGGE